MRYREKEQASRSKTVVALMARRTPQMLASVMGPEAVWHLRETEPYLPPLALGSPEAQLIERIQDGKEDEALALLAKGANARACDEVGLTLLHHAAGAGMLTLMDKLVEHGAEVDALSIKDETALTYAILLNAEAPRLSSAANQPPRGHGRNNILAVIDKLAACHVDTEIPDQEGNTAVLHAAYIGDKEAVSRLKAAGASLVARNQDMADVTYKAAQGGHAELLEQYLRWGIDPRPTQEVELSARDVAEALAGAGGQDRARYLNCAILLARGEVTAEARQVVGLPVAGCDLTRVINSIDAYRDVHERAVGRSDAAIARASLEIAGQMLGFEPVSPGSSEMLLLSAAANGQPDPVFHALHNGADAGRPDGFGYTGVILQAMGGHHDLMTPLKKAGCDVNAADALLNTALHYAAFRQSRECVRVLLALGANPLARNWRGLTPRHSLVLLHQTALSDEFNQPAQPQGRILYDEDSGEGVVFDVPLPPARMTSGNASRVKVTGGDDGPAEVPVRRASAPSDVFVSRQAVKQIEGYEVDPVISAMLEMAESRWLKAEAQYQKANSRKAPPSLQ